MGCHWLRGWWSGKAEVGCGNVPAVMAPMMRLPGDEQEVVVCEEGNCTYLTSWLTAPFQATEARRGSGR